MGFDAFHGFAGRLEFTFALESDAGSDRDFGDVVLSSIQTPLLVAPDDVPAHPYKVAMEVASLAPNAEVTIYPWKVRKSTSTRSWSTRGASSRRTNPPEPEGEPPQVGVPHQSAGPTHADADQ